MDSKFRLGRWLTAGIGALILAYVLIVAALYVGQRHLLFATQDGGALAATRCQAIEGSQKIDLQTPDGETLATWYVAPKPGKPVFLFLHGKGGGLQKKKWRWQRIRRQGHGILAISYRGYPCSSGAPSEAGLITDARTAYNWLLRKHKPEQIIVHGLSLGTGVGVALATQVKVLALILEAPYTAVVDVAAERYPFAPVHWLMTDTFLSRERIAHVKAPVLIAHGTRDTVIPFYHGERLFALANEPKTFVRMPGSDHSTLVRDGLYKHIWKFLGSMKRTAGQ